MKYGFIIDNRKCIGCHACTTACKSEHEVPLGVFRTWVKQVEKGTFPNTRRLFSVLRCNHCTDAPCVEICPVEALYYRPDGIVDFDKNRCIGCKSCMQACPYDALYIDPDTRTAAKCNYCAHRVDVGLEPACVVVCPEHAIISGDMDDPSTEISELLARQQTSVRKPEKATIPNVFYIDGDSFSLVPTAVPPDEGNFWGSQTRGVGHYAKYTEQLAWQGEELVKVLLDKSGNAVDVPPNTDFAPQKSIEVLTGKSAKQVYNAPNKGMLWGWEVPAYVTTKAIATGAFLFPLLGFIDKYGEFWVGDGLLWGTVIAFAFVLITTALLVKDLDQPGRFIYVLLRPQWKSWLVKGGYALTIFGGLLGLMCLAFVMNWKSNLILIPLVLCVFLAIVVSVYTAFLFAQARGRDFWQSPLLPFHMLLHSMLAGSAVFALLGATGQLETGSFPNLAMGICILLNLVLLLTELYTTHSTSDSKAVVAMITKGRYKNHFWWKVVAGCNLLPLVCLLLVRDYPPIVIPAALLTIAGIYFAERIWIEAPQRINLS
jgi:Fe-S-cluster-containing dehydrogenase component/formate-dependent nitrite reductase membrane component NrfD